VHPGFMTDWQQPLVVALTQAKGLSIVHETVYENRFGFTEAVRKMGATIQVYKECLGGGACRFGARNFHHSAVVSGPTPLSAADIEVPETWASPAVTSLPELSYTTTASDGGCTCSSRRGGAVRARTPVARWRGRREGGRAFPGSREADARAALPADTAAAQGLGAAGQHRAAQRSLCRLRRVLACPSGHARPDWLRVRRPRSNTSCEQLPVTIGWPAGSLTIGRTDTGSVCPFDSSRYTRVRDGALVPATGGSGQPYCRPQLFDWYGGV
jgi:hypothetical protein